MTPALDLVVKNARVVPTGRVKSTFPRVAS